MKIVLYDGECGVCNRFVQFLLRADVNQKLQYAPLQGSTARDLLKVVPDLTTMILVDEGIAFDKSTGAIRILATLGPLWKPTKVFLCIPRFLRDGIYDLIARNRHRLGGNSPCPLPSPDQKKRFLP